MFLHTVIAPETYLPCSIARFFAHGALLLLAAFLLAAAALAQSDQTQTAQSDPSQNQQAEAQRPPAQRQRPTLMQMAQDRREHGKGSDRMLIQADELVSDYQNDKVSAVGHVQIYNDGAVLEADQVIYDRKTNRVHAQGNVRYKAKDGSVLYGDDMEMSKDFRDGFANSLLLETPQKTRFAAARVDRTEGDTTVFQSGVYTSCEPCKDDPSKPPVWQVKAQRIIHKEGERTIYYENASFELFGKPIAYFPFFSHPDPTVKRQSGFLIPSFFSSKNLGVGGEVSYFWALTPDKDFTLSVAAMSTQGALLRGEWRQRFATGAFTLKATGIYQLDPSKFDTAPGVEGPGTRYFRGAIESQGQFNINKHWVWGWNGLLATDRTFLNDYRPITDSRITEFVDQLYLVGQGDRSYFDIRAIGFLGMSLSDVNKQLPIIHPVIDYSYIYGQPVLGGQLGFNVNVTSLSRREAEFAPISQTAEGNDLNNFNNSNNVCNQTNTAVFAPTRANCLLRGAPGEYSRASYQLDWKRMITNSLGQVFTPFVRLRADVAYTNIDNQTGVSNFMNTGSNSMTRAMPAIGFEARWPFIAVQEWGTQILEPIAQLIVRPNETQIGNFPNEDSQSLVFSDANLFAIDKYSGLDRVEGGTRLNAGVQYSINLNRYGTINALFGQSYNLFGQNSFAIPDATNTGLQSGLQNSTSDYVARLYYQPTSNLAFITRYLFDKSNFALNRFEAEIKTNFDRLQLSTVFGRYEAQPLIGFLSRREQIYEQASYKFQKNWSVTGGIRYDIFNGQVDRYMVGLSYLDECIGFTGSYSVDNTNFTSTSPNRTFMFRMTLRALSSPDIPSGITTPGPVSGASVSTTN